MSVMEELFESALDKTIVDYQVNFGCYPRYILLSQDMFDELKSQMDNLAKFYSSFSGNDLYSTYKGLEVLIVKYKKNFAYVA